MSSYLGDHDIGLQGLHLPMREEELLDAEIADDTAIFLAGGQEENLSCFQRVLETFCDAFGIGTSLVAFSLVAFGLERVPLQGGSLILFSVRSPRALPFVTWDVMLGWSLQQSSRLLLSS